MKKYLSLQEKELFIELYKKYSARQIAKMFGVCPSVVWVFLRKKGIKPRHRKEFGLYPNKNENYFDVIDTEAKAYFLGLLYADGHNNVSNRLVRITLQKQDKHILEKFANEVFGHCKALKYTKSKRKNRQDTWGLNICSTHMSQKLLSYGVTQHKSFTIKFPSIEILPYNLIHHFMRGYFDGDGCISISKNKKFGWNIIGSPSFCKSYKKILEKEAGVKVYTSFPSSKYSAPLHYISVSNTYNCVFRVLTFLYKDATIFLNRKKKRFDLLKERIIDKRKICNSRFFGVYPRIKSGKLTWRRQITHKGIHYHKYFDSELDAALSYDILAFKLKEGNTKLNFPENREKYKLKMIDSPEPRSRDKNSS